MPDPPPTAGRLPASSRTQEAADTHTRWLAASSTTAAIRLKPMVPSCFPNMPSLPERSPRAPDVVVQRLARQHKVALLPHLVLTLRLTRLERCLCVHGERREDLVPELKPAGEEQAEA